MSLMSYPHLYYFFLLIRVFEYAHIRMSLTRCLKKKLLNLLNKSNSILTRGRMIEIRDTAGEPSPLLTDLFMMYIMEYSKKCLSLQTIDLNLEFRRKCVGRKFNRSPPCLHWWPGKASFEIFKTTVWLRMHEEADISGPISLIFLQTIVGSTQANVLWWLCVNYRSHTAIVTRGGLSGTDLSKKLIRWSRNISSEDFYSDSPLSPVYTICWTTLMFVSIHGNRCMLEHSTTLVNNVRQCWTDVHSVRFLLANMCRQKSTNVGHKSCIV